MGVRIRQWPAQLASRALATLRLVAASGREGQVTLRRRRDEWITLGLAERLRLAVLSANDRLFGLEAEQLAASSIRVVTKPRAAASFCRLTTGNSATAVPMQAIALTRSRNQPQSTRVSAPALTM
jgi:hypothetical protein